MEKQHPITEEAFPVLGERLPNGATVVHYTHLDDGGDGWYPNGVVLASTFDHPIYRFHKPEPWVTWNAAFHPDGKWDCGNGHYFADFFEALDDYRKRSGQ